MTIEEIIAQRKLTHGRFETTARIAQSTKRLWQNEDGWLRLNDKQAESLDCIATKVARILSGDANIVEHWEDIAGYSTTAR